MSEQEALPSAGEGAPGGDMAQGDAEQPGPRCTIYNCIEASTHTVQLPASSAGRAASVRLCPACYSDWREHTDFDRLRPHVDLVRARPPTAQDTPGGGMAAVLRDPDAKKHAGAILELTHYEAGEKWVALADRLGNIGVLSASLAVLLEARDAEREELVAALKVTRFVLLNRGKAVGNHDERAVWRAAAEVALGDVQAALKGGS